MNRLTWQIMLGSLLQVVLLGYFYSDPATRVLNEWLYLGLLVTNSLGLSWLAYRAFQAQRPGMGVVAAVLASPGLLAGAAAFTALRGKG
jgi:hypothetical protein